MKWATSGQLLLCSMLCRAVVLLCVDGDMHRCWLMSSMSFSCLSAIGHWGFVWLTELLRKSSEHTLVDMVQLLFSRLPQFKEDPKWATNVRKVCCGFSHKLICCCSTRVVVEGRCVDCVYWLWSVLIPAENANWHWCNADWEDTQESCQDAGLKVC